MYTAFDSTGTSAWVYVFGLFHKFIRFILENKRKTELWLLELAIAIGFAYGCLMKMSLFKQI